MRMRFAFRAFLEIPALFAIAMSAVSFGEAAEPVPAAAVSEFSCLEGKLRVAAPAAWGALIEERGAGRLDESMSHEGLCGQRRKDGSMQWVAVVSSQRHAKSAQRPLPEALRALASEHDDVELLGDGQVFYRVRNGRFDDAGRHVWVVCSMPTPRASRCATFEYHAPGAEDAAARNAASAELATMLQAVRSARVAPP